MTTSPSSPASTASCRRPTCSKATAPRSSTRTPGCWARSSSSPGTASRESSFRELLPHLAKVVDDLAVIKGVSTDAFNHAPGQIMMSTGAMIFGRPSMGAWVCYGLGSESQDLPAFVVFSTGKKGPSGGNSNWGSGFLPTVYQGVQFRTGGDPVLYLSNPRGIDQETQRDSLEAIRRLDQVRLERDGRSRDRHADQLL